MKEPTFPLSRRDHLRAALTGYKRCVLCNAESHNADGCWIPDHARYAGLINGWLEGEKKVKRGLEANAGRHPVPAALAKKITKVRRWASLQVYGEEKR